LLPGLYGCGISGSALVRAIAQRQRIAKFAEKRLVALTRRGFGHADYGEGFAVAEGDGNGFDDLVAAEFVERDTGEGGAHFEFGEAGGEGGVFAGFEEKSAESAAGPIGMDEDGADFGGVGGGIEKFGFADGGMVAAEEGFALAPAAAGDDGFCAVSVRCFGDKVSLVGDELGVEAENGAEGAFDLGRSVVVGLEDADGGFDEGVEGGNVCLSSEADVECGGHRLMIRRKRDSHRVTEYTESRSEETKGKKKDLTQRARR